MDEIETAFREDLSYRIALWVEKGLSLEVLLDALEKEMVVAQTERRFANLTGIIGTHG